MADYRQIEMRLYSKDNVMELSSNALFLYLYLLTNIYTNMCGCYKIQKRFIAFETRLGLKDIDAGFAELETQGLIKVSKTTNEILIIDWKISNWSWSEQILKRVAKEAENIEDAEFREIVLGWLRNKNFVPSPVKVDEVKRNDNDDDVNDLFEKIWKLYPKKTNKTKITADAKREVAQVGYDKMKVCIGHYKECIKDKEDKYVLGGDTFFNGRYKDYFDDVKVDRSDDTKARLHSRVGQAYNSIIKNFPADSITDNSPNIFWGVIKDVGDADAIINEADRIKLYLDKNGKQKIPFEEFMKQWSKRKKA